MAWVVDTSVLLDIHTGDPLFEPASMACLQAHLADGLATIAFLQSVFISISELWTAADTELAHYLWHQHQAQRRQSYIGKRPVADVLIAAFAMRFQGIITRNAADFRAIAPGMTIVVP